jgi:hypothetical protein
MPFVNAAVQVHQDRTNVLTPGFYSIILVEPHPLEWTDFGFDG